MSGPSIPTEIQKSLDDTKVDYVKLGSSGLRISVPILGGMSLGSKEWAPWVLDETESLEVLKAAYDRGLNTWDTANMYSNGISEQIIGKAIKQFQIPREKVVIMTKCAIHVHEKPNIHGEMLGPQLSKTKSYVNQGGLSRNAIFTAVNASLARLNTDYIDLFQIHRYDPDTPPAETMKALHDLVESGKVRYIGASSMWATQFARMQFIAEQNGWTKFVSMQNYYNLCYREEEREMNRFCNETGVGLIAWSPLFGGALARPLISDDSVRSNIMGRKFSDADELVIKRVEELASKKSWKMSQVALLWLRSKGVIPIVGFNSVGRMDEACGIRGKSLTPEDIAYLEEPYIPKSIVGHF